MMPFMAALLSRKWGHGQHPPFAPRVANAALPCFPSLSGIGL
jgi:hypothetical protein